MSLPQGLRPLISDHGVHPSTLPGDSQDVIRGCFMEVLTIESASSDVTEEGQETGPESMGYGAWKRLRICLAPSPFYMEIKPICYEGITLKSTASYHLEHPHCNYHLHLLPECSRHCRGMPLAVTVHFVPVPVNAPDPDVGICGTTKSQVVLTLH